MNPLNRRIKILKVAIKDKIGHFDRVDVLIPHRISNNQSVIGKIKKNCAGVQIRRLESPEGRYRKRIILLQPRTTALRYLSMIAHQYRLREMITYLEVALDLVPKVDGAEVEIERFLVRHLVKPWHGRRRVSVHENTTYWSIERRTRISFAVYSDRPSKRLKTGNCCHVECRFVGARVTREAGLGSLMELARLDHREFWKKRLQLRGVDQPKLYRLWSGTKRRSSWRRHFWPGGPMIDYDDYRGARIMGAAWANVKMTGRPLPRGSVQALIDFARVHGKKIDRAIYHLPNQRFLPK